jgi:hypothetical protein
LIVDVSDPSRPTVVGELGMPEEALPGMSSRELRVVDDLLVILNMQCSVELHACGPAPAEGENLKLFDISDRRVPRLVANYAVTGPGLAKPSPHEFFLSRPPGQAPQILLAAPGVPSFEVIEVRPDALASIVKWDPYAQGGIVRGGMDNLLHSVSASADGRTAWMSHQTSGLFAVDLSALPEVAMITPPANALKFGVMGPHSAVVVPGRPYLVLTEEVYAPPFGPGCPWGHVRLADISDPSRPTLAGEFKLPENVPCAATPPALVFTSHNATATKNLALVTWYAGGLQAIDISDPTAPFSLAELRPEPLVAVAVEDPGLGAEPVEMWSYPVIQDGLIYVIDSRNGLYILRYHGRWGEEIAATRFAEGNSNLD